MIGVEAKDLLVGDVIPGVGTVHGRVKGPDRWGEITVTVKENSEFFLVKMDADTWLRIERDE